MKKTLLSLFAILAFSVATFAQTGWTLVNSNLNVANGVGQISIGMNNPDALWAYAIGATGLILDSYTKSTDGGLTWTKGSFNAGTGLSQLFAIDENTCWAVFNTGASQGLYKTTDGGTTWVKKGTAFGASSFADAMHFFNDLDGFAIGDPVGGYYEIYTTSDGGETWTRVPQANIPAPFASDEYGITGNYSSSNNNVWFGTNYGRVYRSTDKGLTWAVTMTAFGSGQVVQPEFADDLNGIAFRSYLNVGAGDSLSVTSDGGVTWTGVAVGGIMFGRYIEYIPGTVGTYVGSAGLAGTEQGVSYSTDGGLNWTPIVTGYDLQATAWINPAKGWAGSTAASKKSTGGMYIYAGDSLLPLDARFSGNPLAVGLGGSVTFTNESVGFPTSYNWTFEGGIPLTYAGATPPPIVYNAPGSYYVKLIAHNLFTSDTLLLPAYIYVGGVGVNELSADAVSVFPNPVKDVMTVKAAGNIKEIQVYNATGQLVINQTVNAKTITLNTSGLTTGIYNMKAILDNGTINKKVVIQ